MSNEYQQSAPSAAQPDQDCCGASHQQPASEGHAGRGSDSALKEMREWERRRAANSVDSHSSGSD
jgi:hypothetical protein